MSNVYFVPVYTTRPRNGLNNVLQDDIPPIVGMVSPQYVPYNYQMPSCYQNYQTNSYQNFCNTSIGDDLTFRMRPNIDHIVNRSYSKYGPISWSWTDFTQSQRTRTPVYSGRGDRYSSPSPSVHYRPVYNHYLTSNTSKVDPDQWAIKESTPYDSKSLGQSYSSHQRSRSASERAKEFPFKKYKSDFTPYAPYKNVYDQVKYSPNPDWILLKPWGYKFRKARYVYVPEEENSSKSIEIERVMREARLRELVKGVYSSSYGDSVANKMTTSSNIQSEENGLLESTIKSIETETVVFHKEAERRKPLSYAEKRKRNETLAIGISNSTLLKTSTSTEVLQTKTCNKIEEKCNLTYETGKKEFDDGITTVKNSISKDFQRSTSESNEFVEGKNENIVSCNDLVNNVVQQNIENCDQDLKTLIPENLKDDEKEECEIVDDFISKVESQVSLGRSNDSTECANTSEIAIQEYEDSKPMDKDLDAIKGKEDIPHDKQIKEEEVSNSIREEVKSINNADENDESTKNTNSEKILEGIVEEKEDISHNPQIKEEEVRNETRKEVKSTIETDGNNEITKDTNSDDFLEVTNVPTKPVDLMSLEIKDDIKLPFKSLESKNQQFDENENSGEISDGSAKHSDHSLDDHLVQLENDGLIEDKRVSDNDHQIRKGDETEIAEEEVTLSTYKSAELQSHPEISILDGSCDQKTVEQESEGIFVKVNIQTVQLGSVSEEANLEYDDEKEVDKEETLDEDT